MLWQSILASTLLPIAMSVSLLTESSKLLLLVDQTCVQPHHAPPKYVPGLAAHRGSSPSPRHPRIEHNANIGLLLGVSEYTSLGSPHAKLGGVARSAVLRELIRPRTDVRLPRTDRSKNREAPSRGQSGSMVSVSKSASLNRLSL